MLSHVVYNTYLRHQSSGKNLKKKLYNIRSCSFRIQLTVNINISLRWEVAFLFINLVSNIIIRQITYTLLLQTITQYSGINVNRVVRKPLVTNVPKRLFTEQVHTFYISRSIRLITPFPIGWWGRLTIVQLMTPSQWNVFTWQKESVFKVRVRIDGNSSRLIYSHWKWRKD